MTTGVNHKIKPGSVYEWKAPCRFCFINRVTIIFCLFVYFVSLVFITEIYSS